MTLRLREGWLRARETARKLMNTIPESATYELESRKIDIQQVFFLFCSFAGDVEKTAHAVGLTPTQIAQLASEGDWSTKLAPIIRLQKSKRPGDVERGISRSINFVQAHRMRIFLDRLLTRFSQMSNEELLSYCVQDVITKHKDGTETIEKKLTTRPFADLASALEKCHMLTYYALSDTAGERKAKDDNEGGATEQEIHSTIATAMAQANKPSAKALLIEEQLKSAPSSLDAPSTVDPHEVRHIESHGIEPPPAPPRTEPEIPPSTGIGISE